MEHSCKKQVLDAQSQVVKKQLNYFNKDTYVNLFTCRSEFLVPKYLKLK